LLSIISPHEELAPLTITSPKLLNVLLPFYASYVRKLWYERQSLTHKWSPTPSFPAKETFRKYCKNFFFYSEYSDFLVVWDTVTLFLTELSIGKEVPLRNKFRSLIREGKMVTANDVAKLFNVSSVVGQSLLYFSLNHDFFLSSEVVLSLGPVEVVKVIRDSHNSSFVLVEGDVTPCPQCDVNGIRTFVCHEAWKNFQKGKDLTLRIEELKLFMDKHLAVCKKRNSSVKCNPKKVKAIPWERICHDCWHI